jgi:hypothetical protein
VDWWRFKHVADAAFVRSSAWWRFKSSHASFARLTPSTIARGKMVLNLLVGLKSVDSWIILIARKKRFATRRNCMGGLKRANNSKVTPQERLGQRPHR